MVKQFVQTWLEVDDSAIGIVTQKLLRLKLGFFGAKSLFEFSLILQTNLMILLILMKFMTLLEYTCSVVAFSNIECTWTEGLWKALVQMGYNGLHQWICSKRWTKEKLASCALSLHPLASWRMYSNLLEDVRMKKLEISSETFCSSCFHVSALEWVSEDSLWPPSGAWSFSWKPSHRTPKRKKRKNKEGISMFGFIFFLKNDFCDGERGSWKATRVICLQRMCTCSNFALGAKDWQSLRSCNMPCMPCAQTVLPMLSMWLMHLAYALAMWTCASVAPEFQRDFGKKLEIIWNHPVFFPLFACSHVKSCSWFQVVRPRGTSMTSQSGSPQFYHPFCWVNMKKVFGTRVWRSMARSGLSFNRWKALRFFMIFPISIFKKFSSN